MKYETKTFTIPELVGISAKNIEEHIKLYEGYVKHTNLILEELSTRNPETDAYAIAEMQRRFAFEFDGMRNHEYYFASLEGGPTPLGEDTLKQAIAGTWGSFDAWLARFKTMAKTRGVGWAILYFDPMTKSLLNAWIDEQHLGHLTGCQPILALDMWEHSFVSDYYPSGKAQYVEDFFTNLNWSAIEKNFSDVNGVSA
jgi:Fe-Mn family superoxide dismutase